MPLIQWLAMLTDQRMHRLTTPTKVLQATVADGSEVRWKFLTCEYTRRRSRALRAIDPESCGSFTQGSADVVPALLKYSISLAVLVAASLS